MQVARHDPLVDEAAVLMQEGFMLFSPEKDGWRDMLSNVVGLSKHWLASFSETPLVSKPRGDVQSEMIRGQEEAAERNSKVVVDSNAVFIYVEPAKKIIAAACCVETCIHFDPHYREAEWMFNVYFSWSRPVLPFIHYVASFDEMLSLVKTVAALDSISREEWNRMSPVRMISFDDDGPDSF